MLSRIPKCIQFKCVECKDDSSYVARYDNGNVEICYNYLQTKWQLRDIIVHELIHAYDDCIDPMVNKAMIATDLERSLCSEIRAANLSDDCQWNKELLRGYFNPINYYKNCIKRRAIKSIGGNVNEEQFNRIYNECINNKKPFS